MCDYVEKNYTGISDKIKHFEDNVLFNKSNKGKTVFMIFKATWCGACKKYKEEYEEMCRYNGKNGIVMTIIDVDSAPDLREEYGVDAFPTTFVYKVDDELLNSKHKKLELHKEKIVGYSPGTLAKFMKKYNGI